eukprot:TRINITY_DN19553_c0_g1_i1.p1 TRINITY_DN19553_c0_g1~~TRINITY_DN19553_c0_g1_i1.p1  ORF type:complete len:858 (+),score=132.80 TRINITY_DN19553_c0_g1_i1:69-2642(+)
MSIDTCLDNFLAAPRDTSAMLTKKKLFFLFCTVLLVLSALSILIHPPENWSGKLRYISLVVIGMPALCGFVYVLLSKKCSEHAVAAVVFTVALGVFTRDLVFASGLMQRQLLGLPVLLDMLLLCTVRPLYANILMALGCGWVLLMAIEHTVRFGLLDVWGTVDYAERQGVCACSKPPCGADAGDLVSGAAGASLIALDFFFTRRFANQAQTQTDYMRAVVWHAQEIAKSLAHFDLQQAAESLSSAKGLPPDLYTALKTILENLDSYRPFLPEALFVVSDKTPSGASDANSNFSVIIPDSPELSPRPRSTGVSNNAPLQLPGWGTNEAAFVAVRIWSGAMLWRRSASAIMLAQSQYDTMLRQALGRQGHVLRSARDAYVIAFDSAVTALKFAVDMQIRVQRFEWTADLKSEDDRVDVLAVTTAVHYGPIDFDPNAAYTGVTVEQMPHIEAVSVPEAVTVTSRVLNLCEDILHAYIVVPYTAVVGEDHNELQLTALLPQELSGKWSSVLNSTEEFSSRRARVSETEATADTRKLHRRSSLISSPAIPVLLKHTEYSPGKDGASVGVVKLGFWSAVDAPSSNAVSADLAALHHALKETGGILTTILSRCVVVSWNAHSPCSQHLRRSAYFLLKLMKALRIEKDAEQSSDRSSHSESRSTHSPVGRMIDESCLFHAGFATGPVPSGVMAPARDQSLITLIGPCMDLGLMLCSAAAELNTSALVASMAAYQADTHTADPFLEPHLRPVDQWSFSRDKVRDPVTVHEVSLQGLLQAGLHPGEAEKAWSEEYRKAFALKDTVAMRAMAPEDPVIRYACHLLDTGTHLGHAFMYVHSEELLASGVLDPSISESEVVEYDQDDIEG